MGTFRNNGCWVRDRGSSQGLVKCANPVAFSRRPDQRRKLRQPTGMGSDTDRGSRTSRKMSSDQVGRLAARISSISSCARAGSRSPRSRRRISAGLAQIPRLEHSSACLIGQRLVDPAGGPEGLAIQRPEHSQRRHNLLPHRQHSPVTKPKPKTRLGPDRRRERSVHIGRPLPRPGSAPT